MIFLWVPETKQRTLEELDYVFAVPTHTHMHYQTTKALPYFVNKWILRHKDVVLEPLYKFDSARDTDESRIDDLYEADRARAERKKVNGNGSEIDLQIENTSVMEGTIEEKTN